MDIDSCVAHLSARGARSDNTRVESRNETWHTGACRKRIPLNYHVTSFTIRPHPSTGEYYSPPLRGGVKRLKKDGGFNERFSRRRSHSHIVLGSLLHLPILQFFYFIIRMDKNLQVRLRRLLPDCINLKYAPGG
jgi:hypothetical protein